MQQISFRAMNCRILAFLNSDTPLAALQLEEVSAWFEAWEERLSRFRPESELNHINQRSDERVPVSAVMADVLRSARIAQRESDGLVTPLVLTALETAGYNRSFELMEPNSHLAKSIEPVSPVTGSFRLHRHPNVLEMPLGLKLDLGGVAKGWAADQAANRLGKIAPALVDAGGDVAVSGPQADGSPWPVGVTDPVDPDRQLDVILLFYGGVATSGRDYRRWQRGGTDQHHLIDPRTGLPAQTDVLTATIIGPSARAAETAAKTAFILGSRSGLAWLEERPAFAGLLVLESGETLHTQNWIENVWRGENEPVFQ